MLLRERRSNLPAAVRRKLRDWTQGAEGPLRAAVRQRCRVTVEKAETRFISHSQKKQGKEKSRLNYRAHLILKKLLKEEFPLLPKASSFSRF